MDIKTSIYFEALSCGGAGALEIPERAEIEDIKNRIDYYNDMSIKGGYISKPIKYAIYSVTRLRVFDNDGIIANETTSKTRIEIYPQN